MRQFKDGFSSLRQFLKPISEQGNERQVADGEWMKRM